MGWELVFCSLVLFASEQTNFDVQKEKTILENIFSDWNFRQKGVRTIRFKLKGHGVVPKEVYSGHPALPAALKKQPVPAQDYSYSIMVNWVIDFDMVRIRKEHHTSVFNMDLGKFVPSYGIYIYSGKISKRYYPKELNESPIPVDKYRRWGLQKMLIQSILNQLIIPFFLPLEKRVWEKFIRPKLVWMLTSL